MPSQANLAPPRHGRLPLGTIALAASMLAAYFWLSGSAAYIPDSLLYSLSSTIRNPVTLLTYLFVHVGILHLVGNMIPMLLFSVVLDGALRARHVMGIFLFSGVLSAFVFSFTSPFITLIGASAGISGLMSAAMILRPKQSLALLIALPLLMPLVILPGVSAAGDYYASMLAGEKKSVESELAQKISESRLNSSPVLQNQIAALNESAAAAQIKVKAAAQGKKRESDVPTDLVIHVYGVLAGILYACLFLRSEALDSKKEFVELGRMLHSLPAKVLGEKPLPPRQARRARR